MDCKKNSLSLYSKEINGQKIQLLDEYLVSGSTLDIGCGNGLYGLHASMIGSEVLQVDLEDRRDQRARHLPIRIMDAQELDLQVDGFDNILAFDIMEHLDNDLLFLQIIRKICRKRLILSVPNLDDEQPMMVGLTHMHHLDKTHRKEYTQESLIEVLVNAGFRIVTIRPNMNTALPSFANALAKNVLFARTAARIISFQCKALLSIGLFENRCVADWFCVAE